ncbi:dihydrodipicolinate synthetase [Beutenbergia cavernae DSM 12333]|uniref:Dihydrodipicolinate synthetase n=1 Tax=Beutenbergia cavernae (strain ATCC BAA-8 / DSM 12333 / CCUG 43141 / JCM 11478 / NBRC 16432 / NCIMB 13614 / HKI 0122) TaxID=471853 RepID=C5C541_BEUC1|nr:dihydrodipicolinate synthase family protein [Beutenbergia cavernae]ACQ82181.1 dihydrodipicolinate synthetase [Beutenbergia cavernae DSM 12333]
MGLDSAPGTVRGLVPVLATPFDDGGRLDVASLARLVRFQREAGADALAVFGMASEGFALGADDRRQILAAVREAGDGVPVVAGVSASALAPALDQLHQLADGGATTAMVMPPHMVKPSPAQVLDFFGGLAAEASRVGVAVMIQDAPGATGVAMSAAELADLAALDGVVSIKVEAPPTVAKIEQVGPAAAAAGVVLLGGQNAQFVLDEYAFGAVGTMPACEFTDLLAPILELWSAGERGVARSRFAALLPLIVWGLQPGLAWSIHKEVLVHRGIIASGCVRAPARAASPAMRRAAIDVFESVVKELELR